MPFARIDLAGNPGIAPVQVRLGEEFRANVQPRVIHRLWEPAVLDQLPHVALSARCHSVSDLFKRGPKRPRTPFGAAAEFLSQLTDRAHAMLHSLSHERPDVPQLKITTGRIRKRTSNGCPTDAASRRRGLRHPFGPVGPHEPRALQLPHVGYEYIYRFC